MTGPAPRHDHQDVDQWAQQGLVNSAGRTSPESEVPEVPDRARPDTAPAAASPAAASPAAPAAVTDEPGSTDDAVTDAQAPGTVANSGDAAETAAFEGDGAYSEGRHASGPPAS